MHPHPANRLLFPLRIVLKATVAMDLTGNRSRFHILADDAMEEYAAVLCIDCEFASSSSGTSSQKGLGHNAKWVIAPECRL